MNTKGKLVIRHIVVWAIWFHFFFDFTGLYDSLLILFLEGSNEFDEAFILMPLMIALFYANSDFLIPRFLARRKITQYAIGLVVLIAAYLLSAAGLYFGITQMGYTVYMDWDGMIEVLILSGLIIITVSLSLGLTRMLRQNVKARKEAEQKQKNAELDYLSSTVNPHFLFNSLNSLYYLAEEDNAERTSEAILKLSEIMRYPIREDIKENNTIKDEIKFISDYIDLQRVRLGEHYPIQFLIEVAPQMESIKVAPFMFIPLVENAFKYGTSTESEWPIRIDLTVKNQTIFFKTENTVQPAKQVSSEGFGLKNVKSRLELIYADHGNITFGENEGTFSATISIEITNN